MEAGDHGQVGRGGGDAAGRVDGEEHGGEVAGVHLKGVFAVEDRDAFVVEAARGEEGVGTEVEGCGIGGEEVVGGTGDDGGGVGEQEAEDLIADFAGEIEDGKSHSPAVMVNSMGGWSALGGTTVKYS